MAEYIVSQDLSKSEVNYRHHERCGTCVHFYEELGSCEIVKGRVSKDTVCNRWNLSKNEEYNKDFFEGQQG